MVAAPLPLVRRQIAAVRRLISAHDPYAANTKRLSCETGEDGQIIEEYSVLDRFGPVTLGYRTTITLDRSGAVRYDTSLLGGRVHMTTRQSCEAVDGRVRIHDTVDITAPPVLLQIVYAGVASAQTDLLARLKAAAEAADN
ncbi:hypothetical protein [Nocardia tengchongensis]|uniref:hypothetical protein n=1 Tax=Nocardia tengchongensis TaxID=2055889 RepID=UPI0036CB28B3